MARHSNISARGSYNAPMDAVQEVAVQQNAMDAEFGFSAGGTLNLSTSRGPTRFTAPPTTSAAIRL